MSKFSQFLMPDGRSLASVLKSDVDSQSDIFNNKRKQSKTTKRGKDLQFAFVVKSARAMANSENAVHGQSLAELRTLESVGCRRRRRWLNDRILRDMAGPMTASDIKNQFQPVPFGSRAPSAFEIITQPQNNSIWDGFRNIDSDKEQRVLQRWEEYNRELHRAGRQTGDAGGAGQETAGPSTATRLSGAAEALQRWNRVSRKARQALRKANIHSVLALESQVLDMLEAGMARALQFRGLDGWGRLLVHGLADFYGLASSSSRIPAWCSTAAAVAKPHTSTSPADPHETHEETVFGDVIVIDHVAGGAEGVCGGLQSVCEEEREGASAGGQGEPSVTIWHRESMSEVTPMPPPELTCADIVMALEEAGTGSVSAKQLHEYMRKHVHGSDVSRTESWVVV